MFKLLRTLVAALLWASAAVAQIGTLDHTFDPGDGFNLEEPNFRRFKCALQPDGKIIALGSFTSFDGVTRMRVARLHPDGSLDTSFDPLTGPEMRTYPVVEALALQPDGKVLIGGTFTNIGGVFRRRIARLNADGSLDLTFNCNPGPDSTVRAIRVASGGKIMIGGVFRTVSGFFRPFIARLDPDGRLDLSFDSSTNSIAVYDFVITTRNQVIIAGFPFYYDEISSKRIGRLNSNGSRDLTFNPLSGTDYNIYAIGLEPDGRIVIGGDFYFVNGHARTNIARLNADGTTDLSFNARITAPWDRPVTCLARTPEGKWLAGGHFAVADGYPRNNFLRLNSDGLLDESFRPTVDPNEWVSSIVLQPDGRIIIGGHFTSVDGVPRSRIARLWGDPFLTSERVTSDSVRIKWPSVYTNYVLQSASTLPSTNWTTIANAPVALSSEWVVTNAIGDSNQFFRLSTP